MEQVCMHVRDMCNENFLLREREREGNFFSPSCAHEKSREIREREGAKREREGGRIEESSSVLSPLCKHTDNI